MTDQTCEACKIGSLLKNYEWVCPDCRPGARKCCSFCGRPESDTLKVITGVRASICGECAAMAVSACQAHAAPVMPTVRHCSHVMQAWMKSAKSDNDLTDIAQRYHLPEAVVRIIVHHHLALRDEMRAWLTDNARSAA